MMRTNSAFKLLNRRDLLLLGALALLTGLSFLLLIPSSSRVGTLVVTAGGQEVYRIALDSVSEPGTLVVDRVTIEYDAGGAAILDSDCPDRLCVKQGKLTRPGEAAVCVPAGVAIRLTDGEAGEVDAHAY